MTDYDWSAVTGRAVERLRQPKITPVPARIKELAQLSWDGVENPENPGGPKLHAREHEFESVERASAFAKLMRLAGDHTTPVTSITVIQDPESTERDEEGKLIPVNPRVVSWKAGVKRGRKPTV